MTQGRPLIFLKGLFRLFGTGRVKKNPLKAAGRKKMMRLSGGFIGIIPIIALILVAFGLLSYAIINIYSQSSKGVDKSKAPMEAEVKQAGGGRDFERDKLISSLESSLDSALKENLSLMRKSKSASEETAALSRQVAVKNNQIDALVAERTQSAALREKQAGDFQEKIKSLESEIGRYKAEIEKADKKARELNEKYSRDKNELQSDLARLDKERKKLSEMLALRENDALLQETAKMHYNLANLLVQTRQYDKAVHEYSRALQLLPNDSEAHYNLAVIYDLYGNDPISAVNHYRRCLELDPYNKNRKQMEERIVALGLSQASKLRNAAVSSPKDYFSPDGISVKDK